MLRLTSTTRPQRWFLPAAVSISWLAGTSVAAPQFQLEGRRPLTEVLGVATSPELVDVNGDGALDALFLSSGRPGVSVAIGSGTGDFASPTSTSPGSGPVARFAVGDLEGDGDIDIVAVTGDRYLRMENDGAGNFSVAQVLGSAEFVRDLLLEDVSGDGLADLVILRIQSGGIRDVGVFLGDTQGFFPQFVPVSSNASGVDAADINGDGLVDLILTVGSQLRVAFSAGAGGFTGFDPLQTVGGQTPSQFQGAADVDGDGAVDLFAGVGPGERSFFRGLGAGAFADGVLLGSGAGFSGTLAPLLPDLDGDGDVDVLQFEGPLFGPVTSIAYLQTSPGTFQRSLDTGIGDGFYVSGDLNGDGLGDLLRADFTGELNWLLGNGSAASAYFDAPRSLAPPVVGGLSSLLGRDLDADGDDDVVVLAGGKVAWIESVAPGVTERPAVLIDTARDVRSVEVVDFDGDGDMDLVLYEVDIAQLTRGFSVWLNDGAQGFVEGPGEVLPFAAGNAELIARDFDGDADGDILLTVPVAGQVGVAPTLFTNLGLGTPFRVTSPFGSSIAARQVDTGDFNGDGRIDLAFARLFSSGLYEVTILPGFGLGAFEPPVAVTGLVDGYELQVVDYDGDGMDDLLLEDPALGLAYWRRSGNLQFESVVTLMARDLFLDFQAVDFDGDGDQDVAISRSGDVRLAVQDAPGSLGDAFPLAANRLALPLRLADLDGDGDGDLVEIDSDLDAVFAYENTGLQAIGSAFCFDLTSPLAAIGSASVLENNITLRAQGLPPGQFGIAVAARTFGPPTPVPGGIYFCLTGAVGRFDDPSQILMSSPDGVMSLGLDLGALSVPNGTVPGLSLIHI